MHAYFGVIPDRGTAAGIYAGAVIGVTQNVDHLLMRLSCRVYPTLDNLNALQVRTRITLGSLVFAHSN